MTYLIGVEKGDNRVVHHDKLKRYEGQNRPKWTDRAVRSFVRGNLNLGQGQGQNRLFIYLTCCAIYFSN